MLQSQGEPAILSMHRVLDQQAPLGVRSLTQTRRWGLRVGKYGAKQATGSGHA